MNDWIKKEIKATITDLVADFLYYDRKEDESLPLGRIELAIEQGQVTKEMLVGMFADELRKAL